jgi:hypothetical protein
MHSIASQAPPARSPGLYGLVGLVASLALAGSVLAHAMITGGSGHGHSPSAAHARPGVGDPVSTGFGTVTVERAEKIGGLTSRALAGLVHGVQNLVRENRLQVQVSLLLTNRSGSAAPYSPDQFRLRIGGSGRPVGPQSSTILPGELSPGASIEAHLGFVAPRDGSGLVLEYREPSADEPMFIDLGRSLGRARRGEDKGLSFDPFQHLRKHGR